ncbi:MAG: hypothetical protein UY85_C0073G0006 [Candidatus Peribacteria bacterium GW2011_GWB1_54_5]|nr:MAG: hypothetical protein UY85_C0073G0006 [Candidatus Peribacteria bacterium GW2011_GWB1_54_5]KKW40634.1 MAG: hypothetical protein UY87_C0016G0024 [Candidatus Peribacteria bacterium GW2011_GWC2_54_8]
MILIRWVRYACKIEPVALIDDRHACNHIRFRPPKSYLQTCLNDSLRITEIPMHRSILVSLLQHYPHANALSFSELLQPQLNQYLIYRTKKILLHAQEIGTERTQVLVPVTTNEQEHSFSDFSRSCILIQRTKEPLRFVLPNLALTLLCPCCNICPCRLECVSGESAALPGASAAERRMYIQLF